MLNVGDLAPDFELPNADLEIMSLRQLHHEKNLVLYFYPKDDTPGCTIESIDFSDNLNAFYAADTIVLGVSRDTCESHGMFRDKHGLAHRLLADVESVACNAYDVLKEKESNGKTRIGILRSTFIVNKEGVIVHALYDVKPKGHAAEVLALVEAM